MYAKLSALFGLAVMVGGMFLPILRNSGRPYTFVQTTSGGGEVTIVLLVLSALIAVLILRGQVRYVLLPAAVALALTGLRFLILQSTIDEGLFGYVTQTHILPSGWLAIAGGALIMVAAGIASWISPVATMVARDAANARDQGVPVVIVSPDTAARLAQLKSLNNQGLISAQELEAKRAEIIAGL